MGTDRQDTQSPQDSAPSPVVAANEARRKLLRGGLGAAPVLLSVVSRPTLAADCVMPSAFTSLNVSGNNKLSSCTGGSPEFWLARTGSWPAPYRAGKGGSGTSFNSVFGGTVYGTNVSLQNVLELTARMGRDGLARHLVASALNVQAGLTSQVLSIGTLKAMWAAVASPGYYEPFAGVKWYADTSVPSNAGGGLIAYLDSTYSQRA